jgi:hypothetical protein
LAAILIGIICSVSDNILDVPKMWQNEKQQQQMTTSDVE